MEKGEIQNCFLGNDQIQGLDISSLVPDLGTPPNSPAFFVYIQKLRSNFHVFWMPLEAAYNRDDLLALKAASDEYLLFLNASSAIGDDFLPRIIEGLKKGREDIRELVLETIEWYNAKK